MPIKKKFNKEKFIELYNSGISDIEIAEALNMGVRTVQAHASMLRKNGELDYRLDSDIIEANVRLMKQKQKLADKNRIANKSFREQARIENAVSELQTEILSLLEKKALSKISFRQKIIKPSKKVGGILHLTDLHFNELIDLDHNKYDFKVASKRLRKFVFDAKKYFNMHNVKDVCVCMTGDLINSDRRLDEILSQATNRAKAVLLSVNLLEQVIFDLQKDFNVSVAHVVGNESRITKDIGWAEEVASDNYDTIIHGFLKQLFKNSNVKFFDGNCNQRIIEIVGQTVLLQHGHQRGSTNTAKNLQSTKGLLSSQGINVDFIISGHYHNAKTGDVFSQGSSLAGANAYSNDALQLESRASQNVHIFFDNGNRDSIKVDLQNVENVEGYPIDNELEAYNAKSVDKSKKKVTIFKVVI